MFDPDKLTEIRRLIRERTAADSRLLDQVLTEANELRGKFSVIRPRSTSAISLVASDGGNNRVDFNPFYLQVVRVVDSYGVEQFLDVVSPTTNTDDLSRKHLDEGTALGRMMQSLGVTRLADLSPMLPPEPKSSSWPLTYRDICEWAVLWDLITNTTHSTETLIVRDGLLRSKVFSGALFIRLYEQLKAAIESTRRHRRRDVFLVGIAKHSSVLSRYELAITVSNLLPSGHPLFVPVPHRMQDEVYTWTEYTRPPDDLTGGEEPKFNMGVMYFVRFGNRAGDPVWTIDLLHDQQEQAQKIFGSLLGDAVAGFPVPFYPLCLQQADHHAQVVDLDLQIVKDELVDAIRGQLDVHRRPAFDALQLSADVAGRRYE